MRKPAFRKRAKGRETSKTTTVPAPTGGWNSRENISEMDELFAVETDNMFGQTTDVRVRMGYADHVTGVGSEVETLMPYNGQDGSQILFGAAGDSFYNFTSAGAVGGAVVGSLSNARWEHVNFTNSAGTSYLCCFNGVDAPRYWDDSSWTTITGVSTPAITGITATDISNAFIFKRRMYLLLNNSLSLYYLPIDSVGGATARTRLDGYFSRGGYLVAGGTWTLDGGEGFDDYLVVISSEGELAVFQGTNPSSTSTWSLKGVWNVGEPVSKRCMIKYGGDLLILTVQGVFPLSKALLSSEGDNAVADTSALTYNINTSMTEAASNYKGNFGWGMEFFPQGNQLFLNVPVGENASQQQYVMNTITNSWWRFTEVEANCWAVFNEKMYFGGDGVVSLFGEAFTDNGADIRTDCKQAFSYLGSRGRLKQVKSMRPNLLANGNPSVSVGFALDFGDEQPQTGLSFSANTAGVWDTDTWDNGIWGGEVAPYNDWQTVTGVGTALSVRMQITNKGLDIRHASSDFVYESGGVIG